MKERADKLDYWTAREKNILEKNELLLRQRSLWVNESEMQKKADEAFQDSLGFESVTCRNEWTNWSPRQRRKFSVRKL